ncbi:MAG: ABC transporter ATP-binding protein [Syntrophorhabdales bacterium]|jgi:branched-chain amino acid transport system ATP-binding protein
MLLRTVGLTKHFGGLAAVSQVDLDIEEGQIVGLIGPNGAGKTTVINLISGFLRPTSGKIIFDGKDVTGKKPHLRARMGMGRTFQITPLFGEFTTFKNIVASFYLSADTSLWGSIFNTRTHRKKEEYTLSQAEENLQLVGLDAVRDELAKNLPHGHQKVLDLAGALAVKPKLLLLDEPIGGMSQDEIGLALNAIRKVHAQGTTILLVEHNISIVMNLCDRVIVINYGKKIAEGSPEEVRCSEEVIRAYFGGDYAA